MQANRDFRQLLIAGLIAVKDPNGTNTMPIILTSDLGACIAERRWDKFVKLLEPIEWDICLVPGQG